jgi:error-prone DNA polymerase
VGLSRTEHAGVVYSRGVDVSVDYSELQVTTNFSFLRGASHPHEYIWRAAELGYHALGITDYNSLAGIVRAHAAAQEAGVRLCIGCRFEVDFQGQLSHAITQRSSSYYHSALLVYPSDGEGYRALCRLISQTKASLPKNDFFISLADLSPVLHHFVVIAVPPFFQTRLHSAHNPSCIHTRLALFYDFCRIVREHIPDRSKLSIALTSQYGHRAKTHLSDVLQIARSLDISPVATNDASYHLPERKPLQDVLTAIRLRCTVEQAGYALFANSERYLKPPAEMARLFREIPSAITRTREIADMASQFSLSSLRYTYPREVTPHDTSPEVYLRARVYAGARERYPSGVPDSVTHAIDEELALIRELDYEKYFLTCYDIVIFARRRGILCQGRGAAANSVVCFCLGITAVNPQEIDLLFARFISKERQEPPDIDIDFEHERREEVIQYIYQRYGRERAALTASVITFQARSAVREVAKALGLSLDIIATLTKNIHRWTDNSVTSDTLREIGLNPFDPTIQNVLALSSELVGFPRHLSQHVGGFIISDTPLNEIVPIINSGMESRTIIEWDKNDIEALGILKIDILALGMLTCIRKALALINSLHSKELALHSIPTNDSRVYDMLCASDSIGVFQVESRAQMAMLPRLRPRCFYDLVIQVAIVRPGPIQGNMVHPFLRRRNGLEKPYFPDARVAKILGKTLGVPIFQEQAMRLAITLAHFTPGEAEKLRRAMAAWKAHKGVIAAFKEKIVRGMCANGYSVEFAETCLQQIQGFSEYGFPESHAASFALLVYASAWIKCHYPAEFACALLNSQPMGFYGPAQIIRDAQKHGVLVAPIDANHSSWDCTVTYRPRAATDQTPQPVLRLGLRLVRGLRRDHAEALTRDRTERSHYSSLREVWASTKDITPSTLRTLANADAFSSLTINRRNAHWDIGALASKPAPLDSFLSPRSLTPAVRLPETSEQYEMFKDYATTGLSLRAHPLQYLRGYLNQRRVCTAEQLSALHGIPVSTRVSAAGLAITRQRPGTAKGVVFITLEDETGSLNLIIRPALFERHHKIIMLSHTLLACGKLERIGEVVYIDVASIEALDAMHRSQLSTPPLC